MTDFLVRRLIKDCGNINDPAVRARYGAVAGGVGIFLNLCLFAAKFAAGLLTASIAITADAFNNLSDAGSSVVTFVGFRMAGAPADREHPFGHGRIESFRLGRIGGYPDGWAGTGEKFLSKNSASRGSRLQHGVVCDSDCFDRRQAMDVLF